MQKVSDNAWYMPGPGVLVQFSYRDSVYTEKTFKAKAGEFEFAKWGADNQLPENMMKLATANHMKPKLLDWEVNYLIGSGLKIYRRVIENGKERLEVASDPAIEDWLEANQADQYIDRASYNLVYSGNVFSQLIANPFGKILELYCHDFVNVRAGIIPIGSNQVTQYGIMPDWSKKEAEDNPLTLLEAYDNRAKKPQGNFLLHCRHRQPGQSYYSWPVWWSTAEWTEVSNLIPKFHKQGLNTGYNIKYLIEVADDYFDNMANTETEREEVKKKFRDNLHEFFSGTNNVDRNFMATFGRDATGKEVSNIKITTVGDTDTDKKYIELSKLADINQVTGHGINPALAGIADGGKMGGSGSELRLASQLHTAINVPRMRRILLQPFKLIAKRNGWPADLSIGFADVELTTLDVNPTGKQNTANGATL